MEYFISCLICIVIYTEATSKKRFMCYIKEINKKIENKKKNPDILMKYKLLNP